MLFFAPTPLQVSFLCFLLVYWEAILSSCALTLFLLFRQTSPSFFLLGCKRPVNFSRLLLSPAGLCCRSHYRSWCQINQRQCSVQEPSGWTSLPFSATWARARPWCWHCHSSSKLLPHCFDFNPQFYPFIVLRFGSVSFSSMPTSLGRLWTLWARSWARGQPFSAGANNNFSAPPRESAPKPCKWFWINVPLPLGFKHGKRYPPSCLCEGTERTGHASSIFPGLFPYVHLGLFYPLVSLQVSILFFPLDSRSPLCCLPRPPH